MSKISANTLRNTTLLQLYARAAAPCRDYYGLTVAESCICVNVWRVTRGPHAFPRRKFCELDDFKDDKYLQEEIKNTFGQNVFEYVANVCNKNIKLENLPTNLFLLVIEYLDVNDVLKLAAASKIFYELCNKEEVWMIVFRKLLRRAPSAEERRMAYDFGWKEALKRRLIYVKKVFAASKTRNPTPSNLSSVSKSKTIVTKKKPVKAK